MYNLDRFGYSFAQTAKRMSMIKGWFFCKFFVCARSFWELSDLNKKKRKEKKSPGNEGTAFSFLDPFLRNKYFHVHKKRLEKKQQKTLQGVFLM